MLNQCVCNHSTLFTGDTWFVANNSSVVGSAFFLRSRCCGVFFCEVKYSAFGRLLGVDQFSPIKHTLYVACQLRVFIRGTLLFRIIYKLPDIFSATKGIVGQPREY